ncbi:MAG: hypothetical protein AAGN82_22465 [Myxococcota bacterium]
MVRNATRLFGPLVLLTLVSLTLVAATGCGGEVSLFDDNDDDDIGSGGRGSVPGPAPQCDLAPPGSTFAFRISNVGPRRLQLNYGWGGDWPIQLLTNRGFAETSSWAEPECGTSCRATFDGFPGGCALGGPGSNDDLLPGDTVAIAWDRLTYTLVTANPACTPDEVPDGTPCAFPRAAPPERTEGILTLCIPSINGGFQGSVGCTGTTFEVTFTADLSQDEAVIEVQ